MRQIETKIDNTSPSSTGRLKAAEWNATSTEVEEMVRTAGIQLDTTVDTDLQMQAQAAARYASGGTYGRDLGAANAYVVTTPHGFIMPKALFEGMRVRFFPKANNTGASTLNAFGLGAKKILDQDGAALSSGAIKAGRMTEVDYDPALDTGAGGWKLVAGSNQLLLSGGGTSTITTPGASGSLRPCLSGVTGDLTGLSSCGNAIASSEGVSKAYAFDGNVGTPGTNSGAPGWQPTVGAIATDQWIGWDFDPSVAGYYATIDQAKFQQFHNQTNRTDVWKTVNVEASQDLITWYPIAVFSGCTHPADNAAGIVETVSFAAHSARAFRLRPTEVTRYTSASLLVQVAIIIDVQLIKT